MSVHVKADRRMTSSNLRTPNCLPSLMVRSKKPSVAKHEQIASVPFQDRWRITAQVR